MTTNYTLDDLLTCDDARVKAINHDLAVKVMKWPCVDEGTEWQRYNVKPDGFKYVHVRFHQDWNQLRELVIVLGARHRDYSFEVIIPIKEDIYGDSVEVNAISLSLIDDIRETWASCVLAAQAKGVI